MYFDQLMAVYAHYHVLSSRIKVTYVTPMTSTSAGQFVTMAVAQVNNLVAGGPIAVGERNGAGFVITCNRNMNPKSVGCSYSKADNLAAAALTKGDSTANPTDDQFYLISIDTQAVTSTDVECVVELSYTAQFDDLSAITGS